MFNKTTDGIIRKQNCIYCKKPVNTCNNTPVCSRKKCKQLRKKIITGN